MTTTRTKTPLVGVGDLGPVIEPDAFGNALCSGKEAVADGGFRVGRVGAVVYVLIIIGVVIGRCLRVG